MINFKESLRGSLKWPMGIAGLIVYSACKRWDGHKCVKKRRENEKLAKIAFKNLYKHHRSLSADEIVNILDGIHIAYGIPIQGSMMLWLVDIIEDLARRPEIRSYTDFLAQVFNWDEIGYHHYGHLVFNSIMEILEKFPGGSLIKELQRRLRIWSMVEAFVPKTIGLHENFCCESDRLNKLIARCENSG